MLRQHYFRKDTFSKAKCVVKVWHCFAFLKISVMFGLMEDSCIFLFAAAFNLW